MATSIRAKLDSLFSFDDNDVDDDDEKSYFETNEDGVKFEEEKRTYNAQQASIYPQLHYQV